MQKPDAEDRKMTARKRYSQIAHLSANRFSKNKGSKKSPRKLRHPGVNSSNSLRQILGTDKALMPRRITQHKGIESGETITDGEIENEGVRTSRDHRNLTALPGSISKQISSSRIIGDE